MKEKQALEKVIENISKNIKLMRSIKKVKPKEMRKDRLSPKV